MKDIKVKDINNISIEDALNVYNNLGISFIISDKKIKGLKINR